MSSTNPSFIARFFLALSTFFRVLFDGDFAGQLQRLGAGLSAEPSPQQPDAPKSAAPEAPKLREAQTDAALQLLGLLQREGRLVDFLSEDVSNYSDQDIGAAARVVHDQCKKALDSHLSIERIRNEAEGSRVSIPKGFSAQEIRLIGNVLGEAPFSGSLSHAGWRVKKIDLPKLAEGHDVSVLAPAEVEL